MPEKRYFKPAVRAVPRLFFFLIKDTVLRRPVIDKLHPVHWQPVRHRVHVSVNDIRDQPVPLGKLIFSDSRLKVDHGGLNVPYIPGF